ncbi:hypothetical protein [Rhodohalobacter mucosus]|uniref:STAS domain-containing protein n=1 Tax=Rhodohalobacter mucosus TaxID=2079485 RepID=A0A316TSL8_9BACT|nr:hypothetical protein [Rhodohalobacter mucosus]PWN07410.1 hypothetical protein DDZ15_03865 [Rhodohalobacter mucosus]
MNYKKTSDRLEVTLSGDFNLNAVKKISDLLDDRSELAIDFGQARFANSKAIIFLHKIMTSKQPVKVSLKNPPKIFFELLQTLGLHENWNLDDIVEP